MFIPFLYQIQIGKRKGNFYYLLLFAYLNIYYMVLKTLFISYFLLFFSGNRLGSLQNTLCNIWKNKRAR